MVTRVTLDFTPYDLALGLDHLVHAALGDDVPAAAVIHEVARLARANAELCAENHCLNAKIMDMARHMQAPPTVLDGARAEYVTTDSDGKVTHLGSRCQMAWGNAAALPDDDVPDGDERLQGED